MKKKTKKIAQSSEKKRFQNLAISIVAVLVVISGGVFYFISQNQENEDVIQTDTSLSAEDREAVEKLATDFIQKDGNFGIIEDSVSGSSMLNISYLISQNKDGYPEYFKSRQMAYSDLKPMIVSGSSIYYDSKTTYSWNYSEEVSTLPTYKTDKILSNSDGKVFPLIVNGSSVDSTSVNVTFESHSITRSKTSDDTEWDGSWSVLDKTYKNSAKITFVKLDGEWKVYSLDEVKNPQFLSTWKTPGSDTYSSVIPDNTTTTTLPGKD